ncbi:MAG TPA: hypothetical protein VGB01_06395 [candidate division Zixibacteria bacterium]
MPGKKASKMKIVTKGNGIITRKELFERKERFHKKQAKLPFEEKIRILIRLQGIAQSIHKSTSDGKPGVWKIPSKTRSK